MRRFLWSVIAAAAVFTARATPVIYCTDLFHPHVDPDDHYDLATLLALPELEVKAILLDQGERQRSQPGSIPLKQLLYLAGRDVPFASGLARKLASPGDNGRDQPAEAQGAVNLLLKTLRDSSDRVTIITAGSVRDVCAAWNREPSLFREKVDRLYLNIGNANVGGTEYNVDLDPHAYVGLVRSGLPIYIGLCLPMQRQGTNSLYSTWWSFRQSDILDAVPKELQRFFIYALQRCAPDELDPLHALVTDLRPWRRLIWEMDRNMWCTASFLHAAGRPLHKTGSSWTAARQPPANAEPDAVFQFVPAQISLNDDATTRVLMPVFERPAADASPQPGSPGSEEVKPNAHVFLAPSFPQYASAMKAVLRELLRDFPSTLLSHTEVFRSGQGGYHTYRIPAIERASDGTLLAFAEARKYNSDDPGFGRQDIDLVLKRSTDQGATWSSMVLIEDPGELWSAANPATLLDRANGRLWLFYLRSRPGRSTETSRPGTDDMQTIARWSEDSGQNWSEPIDLTAIARDMADSNWRASVPGPGGAIQTKAGRLLVPIWKYPFANLAIYSDDHGRSWRRGQFVPGDKAGNENQMAELENGTLLMDIRQSSGAHRWLTESHDGGEGWSMPRPGPVVSPVACAIERIFFDTTGKRRERLVWTGPKFPDRRELLLYTSDDRGETFTGERMISDGFAAYSDLTVLQDGSLGVLWERGFERGYQFITFTRIASRELQR